MFDHRPTFDTERVCSIYSEKDGVSIKYVCSTAKGGENFSYDIFYRNTPHPEFGNKYFGLSVFGDGRMYINNADWVEDREFLVALYQGKYRYSQHRHDFVKVDGGFLDGGRAYDRVVGAVETKVAVVRDGEMRFKDEL